MKDHVCSIVDPEILDTARELGGLEIANKRGGQIKRIGGLNYEVLSQSGNGSYLVSKIEEGWICECPDHRFRGVKCRHAWAVEFSLFVMYVFGLKTTLGEMLKHWSRMKPKTRRSFPKRLEREMYLLENYKELVVEALDRIQNL